MLRKLALDSGVASGRRGNTGAALSITARQLFIGILALAVLVRIGASLVQGNIVQPMPGVYDQVSYHALAQRVAGGQGFSFADAHWPATRAEEPTAHWSYLYTLYLSAIYSVFGTQPLIARLLQAISASLLQPWLTWRIG